MKQYSKITAVVVAVLLIGATTRLYANIAVDWSAGNNTFLTLQGGTVGLPTGNLIEIGILSTNVLAVQAHQDDIAFVDANFTEWVTGLVGTPDGIAGAWTINSSGSGTGFFGSQIYLLAYNQPTAGAATQVGLYTNPSWVFPSADGGAFSLDLSDSGLVAIIGSLSMGTILTPSDIAGANAAQLHEIAAPIPEPSTLLLSGIGLLGVAFIKRRRC